MAAKKKTTFSKAQATLSRALRDFEKSIAGIIGTESKTKRRRKSSKKKSRPATKKPG